MLTLKNLLKYDRNLQIMATYGFSQHILYICETALQNENHHLHTSVEYIFERLAAFILPVQTLKQFLRMGIETIVSPTLLITPSKEIKSFVPLNRIKCLVSMTTLRDIRCEIQVLTRSNSPTGISSNIPSIISPPFVECNMGIEGFGALLFPCLSPQSITSSTNVVGNFGMVTMANDIILQGGMTLTNGGERPFPSQYGMTYSTWFYVEKFGPIKDNVHLIRLLTIIRYTFNREDYRFVLQVSIHPKDKSLLVSTQEHPFEDCHNDAIFTDDIKSDGLVKFICSEMMFDQRWTHTTLVWAKGILRNSAVTLYVNGKQIAVQKLHYINNITVPSGNSVSTFAYIGTLSIQRNFFPPQIIAAMYGAGPNYIDPFQAVCIDSTNDVFSPLFPEERIVFGIHPARFFETTLSQFKKHYNKNDAKLIAKQLNMPTNESTVPIRILHKIAALYSGPARTIDSVVIGYLGVRIFVPNPVSKTIEYIDGPHVMLGLITMPNDIESFYASVTAFVCILKANKQMQNELLRTRAYQIWKDANVDIQKSLFDHLLDVFLTSDPHNLMMNQRLAQKINLMSQLLCLLKDGSLHESTRLIIISLIHVLLVTYKNTNDILKLGQFLVYLLLSSSISGKNLWMIHQLSSSNALTRFHDNAMLLVNPTIPSNTSLTSTTTTIGFAIPSPVLNTTNTTPLSPLTTINKSWINVFNDRPPAKPTFALGIDPTLALGSNTNVSTPLPGFVLLQYVFAQRAEIIPIYYQLTALLFRQMPSDDMMEQTEALPENMNCDLTYQIFVQYVFKSIIEYLGTSELCPLSSTDDQTNALPFELGEQSGRTTYSHAFSSIISNTSSTNFNMSLYKLLLKNVTHFIERIVDKIWEIDYREPKQIFEFIIKILNQAKKTKIDSIGDQMIVLDALHRLANNRQLIFSDLNQDAEFFGCLCYCLIILIDETGTKQPTENQPSRSTWYHRVESPTSPIQSNKTLIINAAQRIWSELYMKKKLRIQRLTGGVTGGFRSSLHQLRGTKVKREQIKLDRATIHSTLALMSVNVSSVKENVVNEYCRLAQNSEQKFSYLYEEWFTIERDLFRERSLWGFEEPDPLAKYKLDFIEGPCRMRKRMVLNEDFYRHYPYRVPKRKFNPPVSFDSKQYFDRQPQLLDRLLIINPASIETPLASPPPVLKETSEPPPTPTTVASKETNESFPSPTEQIVRDNAEIWTNDAELTVDDDDDEEEDPMVTNLEQDEVEAESETQQAPPTSTEPVEMGPTNQNILRLLEEDEKISAAFRCARIEGIDGSKGILIFGHKCRNEYIPLIPKSSTITNTDSIQYKKECSKFAYEDLKEVHKRRHILQPIALELFAADGRNYLLVFVRKERNEVYQRLLSSATELTDSAIHSVSGQQRSFSIEQGISFLRTLMGERSVTQRWERDEISNFQYLMYLNTLAGRSYNDLMQYPADYDNKELNLTNPSTFRDLSKPMGAQTIDRLLQFQKRFVEWDDPTGSTPAYHYGTCYSSAMIVASYLVRTEPFAQVFLRLQSGHFELADRMFHSIKYFWLSASKNNMADVKELITEFFYLPNLLLNTNKFDLGMIN
ncbi:unnamed protein product [Rotaria sp. Silwood2]|nr:unnamed protein product [Rotaria sp. Silwood2]